MASGHDRQRVDDFIAAKEPFDFDKVKGLVDGLRQQKDFKPARRLLAWLTERPGLDDAQQRWAHQRLAMAWYHDGEHAKGAALGTARDLLEKNGAVAWARTGEPAQKKAEHLAIMGSVAKRRQAVTGRMEDLEEAVECYDAAVAQATDGRDEQQWRMFNDQGYAAVNAAFVREQLAALSPMRAAELRAEASRLRNELIHQLAPEVKDVQRRIDTDGAPGEYDWWPVVTYAEALLGEGRVAEALAAVRIYDGNMMETLGDWVRETGARQFARLAVLLKLEGADVDQLLAHFTQCGHPAAGRSLAGTFGLALSGGGFRASLFHLGVLARLAELDLLRHVSALSCVSGGSIVGAHYYLALKELLAGTPDANIQRDDYVTLVEGVIESFLAGVGKNLRGKAFLRPGNVVRKLWSVVPTRPRWTRTVRTGQLLGKLFYTRGDGAPALRELLVHPLGEPGFNPKLHNWRRAAKVPMLVINATTLNTGNNFQFTATWLGEPDAGYYAGIDALPAIPRQYFDGEVPPKHRVLPLSTAVGASACVPGVFPPVVIEGLVEGEDRVVALVDGGLQDNQGLGALIDQDCSHIFVSDASGQLKDAAKPAKLLVRVVPRSSSIQARTIRSGVFMDVDERGRSRRLSGAWVVHMTNGLREARARMDGDQDARTAYGIPVRVQERLARIRTDLDRFSENEAHALMLSAYRMTGHVLAENPPDFPTDAGQEASWRFLKVAAAMDDSTAPGYQPLLRELDLGRHALWRRVRRWGPGYKKRSEG